MNEIYQKVIQEYAVNFLEYQKGKALFARGQAQLEVVNERSFQAEIVSTVRDLRSLFDTSAVLNAEGFGADGAWTSFSIENISCTCNEYHVPGKLCRHGIAAILTYLNKNNVKTNVHTSAACTSMIKSYRTKNEYIYEYGFQGGMQVVPRLKLEGKRVFMEFSVGKTHKYIIKDLADFKNTYVQGSEIKLGKKLSYRNYSAAYDDDSLSLIQILFLHMDSYMHHISEISESQQSGRISKIELEPAFSDLYMKILLGKTIEIEDEEGMVSQALIRAENPQIEADLEKKGSEGVHVWLPEQIMMFEGNRHIFIIHGDIFICSEDYSRDMRDFYKYMLNATYRQSAHMDVSSADFPAFITYIIPLISKYMELNLHDVVLEEYHIPKLRCEFEIQIPDGRNLNMTMKTYYDEYAFNLLKPADFPAGVVRDVVREREITDILERFFPQWKMSGRLAIYEEENILEFLDRGLPVLYAYGKVSIDDRIGELVFDDDKGINTSFSFVHNYFSISFSSEAVDDDELQSILESYTLHKKYHRLQNGKILRLKEDVSEKLDEIKEYLAADNEQIITNNIKLPAFRLLYAENMLKNAENMHLIKSDEVYRITEQMNGKNKKEYEIPQSMEATLRDYQKYGFRWLKTLKEFHFNGILADDMGLGKTIQVIALLLSEKGSKTSIIICPASLVYNWYNEFTMFAPTMKCVVVCEAAEERKRIIENYKDYDVIITSYDLFRRDEELYSSCRFFYQVIDEAQYIKNYSTMNAKAVKRADAENRLALTGTPIENRLGELWSIFDFLMPGYLFSYQKFRKMFEVPVMRDKNMKQMQILKNMTSAFLLRRKKSDVLTDLPEKTENIVYSAMEGEQQKLYRAAALQLSEALKQDDNYYEKNRIMVLSQLTMLRQLCCHPSLCFDDYKGRSAKLDTCMELIKRAIAGGHKILLFSQFTTMLDIIKKELEEENIEYLCLTGATDKQERMRMVTKFQNEEVSVFLISLKAGGTGLNLTTADIVIHYDPWWNIAVQNQATDRAYRIGQKNKVTVYRLIAKDTLEEGITELQKSKEQLSDDILSMDFKALVNLSKDELVSLLNVR